MKKITIYLSCFFIAFISLSFFVLEPKNVGASMDENTAETTSLSPPEGSPSLVAISPQAVEEEKTVDQVIDAFFQPATEWINDKVFFQLPLFGQSVPFIVIWLIAGGLFFTLFFRFINFRLFRHAIQITSGKYDEPKSKGEVSHFQALTTALSGTVGIGNIAGVAIAISLGGPGSIFWMLIGGLLGMSLKFTECTLGLKYRKVDKNGVVLGGPMIYLREGLKKRGLKNLGIVLSVIFAIFCIGGSFGGGNMAQINQATTQLINVTGGSESFLYGRGYLFGIFIAFIVGLIIIGGIKSIAKVTDKLVPSMVLIYMLGGIIVLVTNYSQLPDSIAKIFSQAFSFQAGFGGFIGTLILGFRRSAFSNEAGVGSASIAHSAAKTKYPVSEGIVSLLEPFIDTVVVCTMTALVIISTNAYVGIQPGQAEGIELTSRAFETVIPGFPIILLIAVILFAISTMISWSYYGLNSWKFLFGDTRKNFLIYYITFCLFIVIGSSYGLQSVFDFSDAMILAMCFPNILGLYLLASEVKLDLRSYLHKLKTKEIKPYKK